MRSEKLKADTEILIRPMKKSDLAEIMVLERQIFPDPWPRSAFEDHLRELNWGGFVALSGHKVVGYSCWMAIVDEGHLTNIGVAKSHRRKSVAQQLLEPILEITQSLLCQFLLLEVRPSNEGAIAFYERNGFKLLYRRPSYYHNPVEDALVMVKYFDN